ETSLQFLKNVETHESYAALGYYYKNFLQYFSDAFRSCEEIERVIKSGSRAFIVVQNSYFKNLEIDLGKVFVDMGTKLGMECRIEERFPVKTSMVHVNTKSKQYLSEKQYFEDVVAFRK